MKVFFWICLGLLIPGLLLRIPVGGAGILSTDLVVPVFVLIWFLRNLLFRRSFPVHSLMIPGFLFLGLALFSFLLNVHYLQGGKEIFLSFSYLIRFLSMLLFGWAASDIFSSPKDQNAFLKGLLYIALTIVLLGYIQFFLVPDISSWSSEGGWDPHQGRLLGTWLDPNFLGGFLAFLTPVLIGYFYDRPSNFPRWLLGGVILLFLGALFLTFSRSTYVSAALGFFFFFSFRDPKVLLVAFLVASLGLVSSERAQKRVGELSGTVLALVLRDTVEIDPTAHLRLKSWSNSLELFWENPVWGIGYNTYRYRAADAGLVDETYFSSGGSDSTHLTILITTGVVGFFIFLWFFVRLFLRPLTFFFQKGSPLFLGFSSGVLALFVHSFFVNSLLFPFLFLPLISLYAVLEQKALKMPQKSRY